MMSLRRMAWISGAGAPVLLLTSIALLQFDEVESAGRVSNWVFGTAVLLSFIAILPILIPGQFQRLSVSGRVVALMAFLMLLSLTLLALHKLFFAR